VVAAQSGNLQFFRAEVPQRVTLNPRTPTATSTTGGERSMPRTASSWPVVFPPEKVKRSIRRVYHWRVDVRFVVGRPCLRVTVLYQRAPPRGGAGAWHRPPSGQSGQRGPLTVKIAKRSASRRRLAGRDGGRRGPGPRASGDILAMSRTQYTRPCVHVIELTTVCQGRLTTGQKPLEQR